MLVSSIKTNFDSGNLQGKVPVYGKVQYKLSSSRRVGGSDSWVKRCFEGCMDSVACDIPWHFGTDRLVAKFKGWIIRATVMVLM